MYFTLHNLASNPKPIITRFNWKNEDRQRLSRNADDNVTNVGDDANDDDNHNESISDEIGKALLPPPPRQEKTFTCIKSDQNDANEQVNFSVDVAFQMIVTIVTPEDKGQATDRLLLRKSTYIYRFSCASLLFVIISRETVSSDWSFSHWKLIFYLFVTVS
ncbi:unnamed protein product [Trichobilharzia regenti]|nr:unnamed protein product [Trichobilharzia regenti]